MSTLNIVLLIITAVLIIAVAALYFFGRKTKKKQEEQQAQIDAAKQMVTMLIIDKKRLRIKDSGLPQAAINNYPKIFRRAKLPIVKAKIGPQIMSLICDEKIFDKVPVKKEVKAAVSGLYITDVRGLRNPSGKQAAEVKKTSAWKRLLEKAKEKAGVNPVK